VPGLASAGVASDARVSGGWRLAAALQGGVLLTGVTAQAARPKVSRLVRGHPRHRHQYPPFGAPCQPKCWRSSVAPNRAFCGSHIDARSPLVHADERASEQMRYGAPIPVLQGLSVRGATTSRHLRRFRKS
jgi:hypothetical protein